MSIFCGICSAVVALAHYHDRHSIVGHCLSFDFAAKRNNQWQHHNVGADAYRHGYVISHCVAI